MVLTCPTVSTECVSRNQAFIERKGDLINLAKVFSPQEVALRYQTTPYITVLLLRNCSFSFRSPKFLSFAEKIYNQQMDWRGGAMLYLWEAQQMSLTHWVQRNPKILFLILLYISCTKGNYRLCSPGRDYHHSRISLDIIF